MGTSGEAKRNVLVNVLDGAGRAVVATFEGSGDPCGSTVALELAKQLYGHGYWGAGAVGRRYFGKSPAELRQRHGLDQLVVNHYLTAAQANAAYAEPLELC